MGKRARANKLALSGKRRDNAHDKARECKSLRLNARSLHTIEYGGEQERKANYFAKRGHTRDDSKRLLHEHVNSRVKFKVKRYERFANR